MKWAARLAAPLLVLALLSLSYAYMDLLGDTFWSIASGRFVLEHRALPREDPFSFTAGHARWIVHMPACQILFAAVTDGVTKLLGAPIAPAAAVPPAPVLALRALTGLAAAVHAASLALLVLPHAKTPAHRLVGGVLAGALVFLQRDDLCVRGQLFGDLLFAVLVLLLFCLRDGRRVPWWAPVLLGSAWINLHSSYLLSVAVPLFVALVEALERREALRARRLVAFAALAFAGSFLNPYFHKLPLDLFDLFRAETTARIDLFRPPDPHDVGVLAAFAFVLGTAAASLRRHPSTVDALTLLAFACASATGRRYLPLACAFAIVVVLRSELALPARLGHPLATVAAALAACTVGLTAEKNPYRDVPVEEAARVEQLDLGDHVASPYHWGGYLDFAWHERRRVLVDGRNQLFGGGAFDAGTRLAAGEHVRETLSAYRINTVLWESGSALDAALAASPEWSLVHRGPIAVLYRRVHPVKTPPVAF